MSHTHHHHSTPPLTAEERLDPSVVKKLSKLNPWLSAGHIVFEYIAIFAAIFLANQYRNPLVYILAVMWIGARAHALAILLHEASHYRILKNKAVNDFVGELFFAFPLFVTMRGYRLSHMAHHRNTNTEFDPDWVSKETPEWEFPQSRGKLFLVLARIALGMNIVWMIKMISAGGQPTSAAKTNISSKQFIAGRIAYYVALVAVLTYLGLWMQFLLFWIVPIFTWLQVILRIRSIAEHFGIEYDHVFSSSRTTYPSLFDRIFIASKNVWFHIDHHLYPSIPFYNLPALHKELNKLPSFRENAHITHSYLGVLLECTPDRKLARAT